MKYMLLLLAFCWPFAIQAQSADAPKKGLPIALKYIQCKQASDCVMTLYDNPCPGIKSLNSQYADEAVKHWNSMGPGKDCPPITSTNAFNAENYETLCTGGFCGFKQNANKPMPFDPHRPPPGYNLTK